MIISVEKTTSGMYASIPKKVVINTLDLNKEQKAELEQQIKNSDFFNLPATIPSKNNSADYNVYRITIETENKKHRLTRSNFSMDNNISSLIKIVLKYTDNTSF